MDVVTKVSEGKTPSRKLLAATLGVSVLVVAIIWVSTSFRRVSHADSAMPAQPGPQPSAQTGWAISADQLAQVVAALGEADQIETAHRYAMVRRVLAWAESVELSRRDAAFLLSLMWNKSKLRPFAYEARFGTFNLVQFRMESLQEYFPHLKPNEFDPLSIEIGLAFTEKHFKRLAAEVQRRGHRPGSAEYYQWVYILWNRWIEERNLDIEVSGSKVPPRLREAKQDQERASKHGNDYARDVAPLEGRIVEIIGG